jgi:hypothetical protein
MSNDIYLPIPPIILGTGTTQELTSVVPINWINVQVITPTNIYLPPLSKFYIHLGILINQNCGSNLITLLDPTGAYIDYNYVNNALIGSSSRIMWAGETAFLFSNGSYWQKTHGKSISMASMLGISGNQTFSKNTPTLLNFNQSIFNNAPTAIQNLANSSFVIQRAGLYLIKANVNIPSGNNKTCICTLMVYKNGNSIISNSLLVPSNPNTLLAFLTISRELYLNVGDVIQLYGNYNDGSFPISFYYNDSANHQVNWFSITEQLTW